MKKTRPPKKSDKWYLPEHEYRMVVNFCLNYGEYKRQLVDMDGRKAIVIDGMPHGTDTSDPTAELAMRRARIQGKIDLIERTVRMVDASLYDYLLLGITTKVGFDYLESLGIPIGKDLYIRKYREVYWRIAQEI